MAVGYGREIDDKTYTFGVSGKLLRNTVVFYDHQTGSLWSSVRHEAIRGTLQGKRLTLLDNVTVTTWSAWKKAHPKTKVLSVRGVQSPGYDTYAGYHRSYKRGIVPVGRSDGRVPDKTVVIGLRLGNRQKAYPFPSLRPGRIIQDSFADRPVLLARLPQTGKVVVYEGRVDGRELKLPRITTDGMVLDANSASTLDLNAGKFVDGPLEGKSLQALEFTRLYWFAWVDYYPKTEVYRHDRLR